MEAIEKTIKQIAYMELVEELANKGLITNQQGLDAIINLNKR